MVQDLLIMIKEGRKKENMRTRPKELNKFTSSSTQMRSSQTTCKYQDVSRDTKHVVEQSYTSDQITESHNPGYFYYTT